MKIIPHDILGEVNIPSSKSVLHREIILASLANDKTIIYSKGFGKDILHTIECLNTLGAKIDIKDDYILVTPIKKANSNVIINVGESGSTLRFLLPVISTLGVKVTVDGSDSIKSRPIEPIIRLLREKGVKISSNKLPLEIEGKLTNGDYIIDGSLSSQFATGLLIALSNIKGRSTLKIENLTSSDYIDITLSCLSQFNVNVKKEDKYLIEANTILSPKVLTAEGDWSSSAFILALGVLSGKVTVKNLKMDSFQGDKIIVDILRKMGAKIDVKDDIITAYKSELNGVTVDIKNCPDIAPILSILMGQAKGESKIISVDRLKIKESNRLTNIIKMLEKLNIKTKYENDTLTIYGGTFKECNLLGENDHRIALASIVALNVSGGTIEDYKCMDKSYPTFLEDFKNIGGCFE